MKFKLKTTGNDVLHLFTGGAEVGGETRALYGAPVKKKGFLQCKVVFMIVRNRSFIFQ